MCPLDNTLRKPPNWIRTSIFDNLLHFKSLLEDEKRKKREQNLYQKQINDYGK